MSLVSPRFSLKASLYSWSWDIQALDSVGSKMEPKGMGGGPERQHFQTCVLSCWYPSPLSLPGPDPLLV